MSDVSYIAWSLVFAAAFAMLFVGTFGAVRYVGRRRRVAFGLGPARVYRQRFRPAYALLYVTFFLLVGLYIACIFAPSNPGADAPQWTRVFGRGMPYMAVLGVVLMLDSFQPEVENPTVFRGIGITILLVSAVGIGLALGHVV